MDSPTELAAKKLAWEMEPRKSVEVRITYGINKHKPLTEQPTGFNTVVEHYIETSMGQRFYDSRGLQDNVVKSYSKNYGDGTKFAEVNYDSKNIDSQDSVVLRREFWMEEGADLRRMPIPLKFEFVGREPLYKALPKARYLGKGEVIGRECNLFLFPQVRWYVTQDQVFHLDQATSTPLKVEAYLDESAREKKEPMWVWTAISLDKVQGHFVPLKSTQITYNKDGSYRQIDDYQVESIVFDKEYPASTFRPVFQPGVTVLDGITGKMYVAPGIKKAVSKKPKEAATTVQPIKATLPDDWSSSAPFAAFGPGGLVLIVAGLLWRRSRWDMKRGRS